jgi:anti-anti-sigma factor
MNAVRRCPRADAPRSVRGDCGGAGIDARPVTGPGTLAIRVRRSVDGCVIELSGECTATGVSRLAETLEQAIEQGGETIQLDLSKLEAIDRSGVHTILTAHLRAGNQLQQFLIVPGRGSVQRVLDGVQGPFAYVGRRP